MENGSCGASPECSCNVEWKQSIKLLCVSSAGATVSTRLNSFIYANIHIYILPLSPRLHWFFCRKQTGSRVMPVACISCSYWLISSWQRSFCALLLGPCCFSQWEGQVWEKNRAIGHQNENLVHDWCHGCKLWWKVHPLEGGRPMLLISF